MNKQLSNPSELARETLRTLASRKVPPTPDNYAKIYAEISGVSTGKNSGAEEVLHGIAEHLAQGPKSAPTGVALKKAIGTGDWEQCLQEIEKALPRQDGELIQSWSELIRDLLRQLETPHKGLTITRKKEGVETVLARFASNPETLFEKLNGLVRSWSGYSTVSDTIEIDSAPPLAPPAKKAATPAVAKTITSSAHAPDGGTETFGQLAELLAQT